MNEPFFEETIKKTAISESRTVMINQMVQIHTQDITLPFATSGFLIKEKNRLLGYGENGIYEYYLDLQGNILTQSKSIFDSKSIDDIAIDAKERLFYAQK